MNKWININKQNLLNNLKIISEICLPAATMPVLKSNAYGHGLQVIYDCIKFENLDWIGVHSLEEGLTLRKLGWKKNVLIMGNLSNSDEFNSAYESHLDVIIGSYEQWDLWNNLLNKPAIHLKIDTGMCRQGFLPTAISKLLQDIAKLPSTVPIKGVMTHFADVEDNMDQIWAKHQWNQLVHVLKQLKNVRQEPFLVHSAATAAALVLPESRFDLCRIGIGLYGLWPGAQMPDSPLRKDMKPVLSWHARLTQVKHVPAHSYVGYGCNYRTRRKTLIGVIPIGYFEGFPRLAGQGDVLIQGRRCQILGRICMNMMMVDLTDLPTSPQVGDIATLIGQDGEECITANEIAHNAQTIHYEIVTRLQADIPRLID